MAAPGLTSRWARAGIASLLAIAAVLTQFQLTAHRPTRDPDDLLYLPNERLLNHFTAGMSNVMADYLWVQCCTYVGRQVQTNWNFQWLRQMIETVVRLDPYFVPAYRYGAMFLAALRQEDEAALDLLHRGMILNPDSWELPYEAAMVHLLNRKDEPDSKYNATFYLTLAVETGEAPAFVAEVASALQGQYNLVGLEKDMWEKVQNSDNQLLRDLAKSKLEEVRIKNNLRVLEDLIERHRVQFGEPPKSLDRLIEVGYIPAIEHDPLGGRYFLGPDGRAKNETLLSHAARDVRAQLEEAVRAYHEKHGAFPDSLETLVSSGQIGGIALHPWPGKRWTYDPASGSVGEAEETP